MLILTPEEEDFLKAFVVVELAKQKTEIARIAKESTIRALILVRDEALAAIKATKEGEIQTEIQSFDEAITAAGGLL